MSQLCRSVACFDPDGVTRTEARGRGQARGGLGSGDAWASARGARASARATRAAGNWRVSYSLAKTGLGTDAFPIHLLRQSPSSCLSQPLFLKA